MKFAIFFALSALLGFSVANAAEVIKTGAEKTVPQLIAEYEGNGDFKSPIQPRKYSKKSAGINSPDAVEPQDPVRVYPPFDGATYGQGMNAHSGGAQVGSSYGEALTPQLQGQVYPPTGNGFYTPGMRYPNSPEELYQQPWKNLYQEEGGAASSSPNDGINTQDQTEQSSPEHGTNAQDQTGVDQTVGESDDANSQPGKQKIRGPLKNLFKLEDEQKL